MSNLKSRKPELDAKRKNHDRHPKTLPRRTELMVPPLNASIAQVFIEIKNEKFVKWPGKNKTNPL